jgi:hypothetical protein
MPVATSNSRCGLHSMAHTPAVCAFFCWNTGADGARVSHLWRPGAPRSGRERERSCTSVARTAAHPLKAASSPPLRSTAGTVRCARMTHASRSCAVHELRSSAAACGAHEAARGSRRVSARTARAC